MIEIRRMHMTLMELIIGIALASLLLMILTFFYQQMNQLNIISNQFEKEAFQQLYIETRLTEVLPETFPYKISGKICFFTTGSEGGLLTPGSSSLIFAYKTGVNLDRATAVNALGRLFLDKQHRLCLGSWDIPKANSLENPKMRQEILLEGVETLQFEFYVAPQKDRSIVKGETANPNPNPNPNSGEESAAKANSIEEKGPPGGNQWVNEWRSEYSYLPFMMKMKIKRLPSVGAAGPSEIIFAFPLPRSDKVIVYE